MKKSETTNIATAMVPPQGGGTNDLRPIKPPVELSTGLGWFVAALLVALALVMFLWWRRRKSRTQITQAAPPILPHVLARQRLEQALSLISDPRLFCIAISDTLRHYLEDRFGWRAPEQTTPEFLSYLSQSDRLLADQKTTLAEFLERCDLVKFAKHEPTETELRQLFVVADRLIEETYLDPTAQTAVPT